MKDELLVRYIQGTSTDEETEEVMKWIEKDKENEKYLIEMQHLFNSSLGWDAVFQDLETEKSSSSNVYRFSWRKIGMIAASLLIFFLGGWMCSWNIMKNKMSAHSFGAEYIKVPARQRLDMVLADGTKVCLNANSTLRFSNEWNKEERRVLLDGEAFFEVAHDEKRPFIVETKAYDIQVLGTTFNVNAYKQNETFKVMLLEGAVQINDKSEHEVLRLSPDEEAILTDGFLVKQATQGTEDLYWKKGILVFQNECYQEIFEKLQIYYNVEIKVENIKVSKYRATAKFYTDSGLDHILKVLQQFNHFNYTWNEKKNKIIIN